MGRKLLFKVLVSLTFVVCAFVWLLSVLKPEWFNGFNLCWLLGVVPAVVGVLLIIYAFISKTIASARKFYVIVGGLLVASAVFAFVGTLFDNSLALPIIAFVLSIALMLSLLISSNKPWDQGDNQKPDYKNYYERKKEKEEENK